MTQDELVEALVTLNADGKMKGNVAEVVEGLQRCVATPEERKAFAQALDDMAQVNTVYMD